MKSFILRLALYTVAFYCASFILKGIYVNGIFSAFLMAIAFTFLNQWIKPVLTFISLPITCLTMGIFQLVVNMSVLWMADWLVDGFKINGLFSAAVFTVVLIVFNGIISLLIPSE